MSLIKVLAKLGKNALAFVIGAIPGAVMSVAYGVYAWLPEKTAEQATTNIIGMLFSSIAYLLLTVLLFGVIGIAIGGLIGILVYNVILSFKKTQRQVS